jgi:hypothetical protein
MYCSFRAYLATCEHVTCDSASWFCLGSFGIGRCVMIWNTESWIHAMCALRCGRAMAYVVLSGSGDRSKGMGCSIVLSREFCGLGLGNRCRVK